MSLSIHTVHGLLTLGDAVPSAPACTFCGAPAQITGGRVSACAGCAVNALEEAADRCEPEEQT